MQPDTRICSQATFAGAIGEQRQQFFFEQRGIGRAAIRRRLKDQSQLTQMRLRKKEWRHWRSPGVESGFYCRRPSMGESC